MKIVFFGTDAFVDPVLKSLEENFETLAIRDPKNFTPQKIGEIKKSAPDLFVVASFGVIFPKNFLAIPKFGAINIHPSLLPKYRGPSPIQNTILMGDKITGVTIIKMDEEVDHGPIIYQETFEVSDNDTFESLAKRLFEQAASALPATISKYTKKTIKPTQQDHTKATFTQHLSRQDGYIDMQNPPSEDRLERTIRAYFPWPGTWTKTELGGAEKIIKLLPNDRLQVEGKKEMSHKDFINGYKEGEKILEKLGLN